MQRAAEVRCKENVPTPCKEDSAYADAARRAESVTRTRGRASWLLPGVNSLRVERWNAGALGLGTHVIPCRGGLLCWPCTGAIGRPYCCAGRAFTRRPQPPLGSEGGGCRLADVGRLAFPSSSQLRSAPAPLGAEWCWGACAVTG
ncbi:hypothetical protein NDU88_000712 [Pleurodeles waltl]|uniref:Uncharacterized protein n=1 Tax=Pleurodeles waltl TaxID=8319 RepID=A0AAV7USM7_PLEWA|nr:hypothetical protein NDU88_000712 [Pleurodeles waltl]